MLNKPCLAVFKTMMKRKKDPDPFSVVLPFVKGVHTNVILMSQSFKFALLSTSADANPMMHLYYNLLAL